MKHGYIKGFVNHINEKKIIFYKDGKSYISYYDDNKTLDEIENLMHKNDIYKQMSQDFKKELGGKNINDMGDSELGYILKLIHDRNYSTKISNIQVGDPDQRYGGY